MKKRTIINLIKILLLAYTSCSSFPMPYFKLFYCKNLRRYSEKKTENDGSAFLHFLDSIKHILRFLGL